MTQGTSNFKADALTKFRFPFTVNEIFSCELNSILEKFFEAPEPKVEEKSKDKDTGKEPQPSAQDKKSEQSDEDDKDKEDFYEAKETRDDESVKTEEPAVETNPEAE